MNPATLLPVPYDDEPRHDFAKAVFHSNYTQEDLLDQPLKNSNLTLITGRSLCYMNGKWYVGYVVVKKQRYLKQNLYKPWWINCISMSSLVGTSAVFILILSKFLECVMQWVCYGKNEGSLPQQESRFLMELKSDCSWKLFSFQEKLL